MIYYYLYISSYVSAANAVVSGAIDSTDSICYFSNMGQCVDVFSPGLNVISACAKAMCGNNIITFEYNYIFRIDQYKI